MKHSTVILLTLFVLQINALPNPTLARSISEHEELPSENVSLESKGTRIEQKSTNEITKKELKSSASDILGSTSIDTKVESNKIESKIDEKALIENERVESKSLISDSSSISTKTEKDQKSVPENAAMESQSSTNEAKNIPTNVKTDQQSSLRSQETPTSRSNKDNEESTSGNLIMESTDTTSGSSNIPTNTKIESLQNPRPPSYYYDMFNIPIAALQAVSNFLGGSPTNPTYIRPPAASKPPVSKLNLRSPITAVSETPGVVSASSDNANRPVNIPNIPGLNLINQISQFANNHPGMLLRLPTIQDIINIPISTLNAVSHFLAQNYAAQPAPIISSPPVIPVIPAASNVVPSKISTEGTVGPSKELLKSGPLLQNLDSIPDHSTLIGVTEEVASTTHEQYLNNIKAILLANPNYYQDMINIPIVTLKAVSNFLATVYVDPSISALPLAPQGNKITTEELSSPSTKTSQTTSEVVADTIISTKAAAGIPLVTDKSSENSRS